MYHIVRTGLYYFYASVDDVAQVYGRRVSRLPNGTEIYGSEELLVTANYNPTSSGQYWPTCAGCKVPKSRGIDLLRGERYQLRVRFVNTGGPDQVELAMKVVLPGHVEQQAMPLPSRQPVFVNTSQPSFKPSVAATAAPSRSFAPTVNPTRFPTLGINKPTVKPTMFPTCSPTRNPSVKSTVRPTANPTIKPTAGPTALPTHAAYQYNASLLPAELRHQQYSMSNTFLRHHALKDTQIVALKVPFFYEIQVRVTVHCKHRCNFCLLYHSQF